ncbi:Cyclin-dependent kinase C-2 [Entamoeba marina]
MACPSDIPTSNNYLIFEPIGGGTYSTVYRGQRLCDSKYVAIKTLKVSHEREGFSLTSLREIQLLQSIKHDNIVELLDVIYDSSFINGRGSVSLIFEYMPQDLASVLADDNIMNNIPLGQLKGYMHQLLIAVNYLHNNNILHRDIKTGNLLISNTGSLKLTDFGLSRRFNESGIYTENIVTLWYRSPELLLGEVNYSTSVDMWSIGCVFLEIMKRHPIFKAKTDAEQLIAIFSLCGSPNEKNWPNYTSLPYFQYFKEFDYAERVIKNFYSEIDADLLDLVDNLLTLDPNKRMNTKDALAHRWFSKMPIPYRAKEMYSISNILEFSYRENDISYDHMLDSSRNSYYWSEGRNSNYYRRDDRQYFFSFNDDWRNHIYYKYDCFDFERDQYKRPKSYANNHQRRYDHSPQRNYPY